jgi:hypothetical protein
MPPPRRRSLALGELLSSPIARCSSKMTASASLAIALHVPARRESRTSMSSPPSFETVIGVRPSRMASVDPVGHRGHDFIGGRDIGHSVVGARATRRPLASGTFPGTRCSAPGTSGPRLAMPPTCAWPDLPPARSIAAANRHQSQLSFAFIHP